jgi:glucose-1-phosphate adenylyltransferase
MENIIGLITYGRGEFGVLAAHRPAYMLPFGCRYRLIDFALSTFSNNDIDNVALYAGSMLRSTIDHIGNGKPWDLNRRFGGLSIFPEVYSSKYNRSDELVNIYESLGFYESAVEEQIFFMDPIGTTMMLIKEK